MLGRDEPDGASVWSRMKPSSRRGNGHDSEARDLGAMWSEVARRDLEFALHLIAEACELRRGSRLSEINANDSFFI